MRSRQTSASMHERGATGQHQIDRQAKVLDGHALTVNMAGRVHGVGAHRLARDHVALFLQVTPPMGFTQRCRVSYFEGRTRIGFQPSKAAKINYDTMTMSAPLINLRLLR